MTSSIYAFIGMAGLLTIIPGADMALVTKSTLKAGRRAAFHTTLGICTGLSIHALASALGLSAILRLSAIAFRAVQLVGAAYLVVLGAQTLRESMQAKTSATLKSCTEGVAAAQDQAISARAFWQGVWTNLLNPKVALFYLTVLPQFINPTGPVLAQSLLLASIHIGMGLVWLSTYAYFLARLDRLLGRPLVKRTLERITGGLLIALGLRLAWERH
jgi:threonine/homoserine/homoserine lactone efflux protein